MSSYQLGRLINHVHLLVADLDQATRFSTAVLSALDHDLSAEGDGFFAADALFLSDDGEPTTGLHLALQATDRDTVDRFHQVALAAGATDNGAPGERHYHPGSYAASVSAPDGTNLEAVYHDPTTRSAPSITIQPAHPKST